MSGLQMLLDLEERLWASCSGIRNQKRSLKMHIRVLFFARLREAFSSAGETITLPEGATVASLVTLLRGRGAIWDHELGSGRIVRAAVNQIMVKDEAVLHDGDELALFPPVTGG